MNTPNNSELEKPDLKLVRALQKDFEKLYVKEFTTAWKENRLIRNIELGIMRLDNLEALINKQIIEARIDELDNLCGLVWNDEGTTDWLLLMLRELQDKLRTTND